MTQAVIPVRDNSTSSGGFAWQDGVIRPLPTLGGNNEAAFGGANDEGQIVGMSETAGMDKSCQPTRFYDSTINQTITLKQRLDWKPVVWGPDVRRGARASGLAARHRRDRQRDQ